MKLAGKYQIDCEITKEVAEYLETMERLILQAQMQKQLTQENYDCEVVFNNRKTNILKGKQIERTNTVELFQ